MTWLIRYRQIGCMAPVGEVTPDVSFLNILLTLIKGSNPDGTQKP